MGVSHSDEKFIYRGPDEVIKHLEWCLSEDGASTSLEVQMGIRDALVVAQQAKDELPLIRALYDHVFEDFSNGCSSLFGIDECSWWNFVSSRETSTSCTTSGMDNAHPVFVNTTGGLTINSEGTVLVDATDGLLQSIDREDRADRSSPDIMISESTTQSASRCTSVGYDETTESVGLEEITAVSGPYLLPDWVFDGSLSPDPWADVTYNNPLHRWFGPTALPMTHTTGIVELSTRRIKSILPPAVGHVGTKLSDGIAEAGTVYPAVLSPDAVEQELDAKLAKIVFTPWPIAPCVTPWGDYQDPRILQESRGPVVSAYSNGVGLIELPHRAHDPLADDIVVYVNPDLVNYLRLGIGIRAVWVQLARVDVEEPVVVDIEHEFKTHWLWRKTGPGGPGVPIALTNIWYMASVSALLPTYHTDWLKCPDPIKRDSGEEYMIDNDDTYE